MSTDTDAPLTERVAGNVCLLPIARLRTSYGSLRPGRIAPRADQGGELPLRVAPCPDTGDGEYFEVLDGFKRLQRWREQGATVVPVVIETPAHTVQHKRLLLAVNAPARTLTALDEARVVCSLLEEDGLTPTRVARLVGRKPDWVERRKAIGTRLSPSAQDRVARGALGPTLAHALTSLPQSEQDALLASMERHGLSARESLMLVATWRVADSCDRKELLRDPLQRLRGERANAPTVSPRATQLESELHRIRRALSDLAAFQIPAELSPAEQRRLEALHRAAVADLLRLAAERAIPTQAQENDHDRYRPREPDDPSDFPPGR
ncbi:MAG TPA: hypothetical protein P5163_19750, partial [Rubrivivax sp.]|nr:hypothetical protein [Rubrivivax sp.]